MTTPANELETKANSDGLASIESYRNPTYPKRDHYGDRPRLEQALRLSEERIAKALEQLEGVIEPAGERCCARLYHQLLGIRDQIAESVRRMPVETGELYREDKERFDQAAAALDGVWQQWQKIGG